MKNKLKIPSLAFYVFGILMAGTGISLMIKTGLGIAVVSSFPYSLAVITGILSVGMWVTLIQCLILLVAVFLLKRLTVSMLATFITGYFLGLSIDVSSALLAPVVLSALWLRLLIVVAAAVIIGIGAGSMVFSGYPPVPDLVFLRDVSRAKNIGMTKLKMLFDGTFLVLTVVLTLLVLGHIIGVGWGTVISVLIIGPVVGQINVLWERISVPTPLFKNGKEQAFLEFNLLGAFLKRK